MARAEYTYTLMLGSEWIIEKDFVLAYDVDLDDGAVSFHDVLAGGNSLLGEDVEAIHRHLGRAVLTAAEADTAFIACLIAEEADHTAYQSHQRDLDGLRTYGRL